MTLNIPGLLKKGDRIGFVSPSSGPDPRAIHRAENAKKMFKKLGYEVEISKHALNSKGYVSGSVDERIRDIHEMFLNPEIKAIICTIGGNNSNQLLKNLNYDLIKTHPKMFMGYSDITVLHYAIQSQANLATYYGPCAMTQFGEYPAILKYTLDHFNFEVSEENKKSSYLVNPSDYWTEEFLDWFQEKDMERPRKLEANEGHEWISEGKAEGPILGGAILSVNHLLGTKYWINPEGSIFFLDVLKEDNILNESAVDALLTDLYNVGVFDVIKGLIIGRPAGYSPEEKKRLKKMIKEFTKEKKCPILFNANMGHTDPIITIRYGRRVRLDSSRNEFAML